ncbi:hypothetical protein [Nitratireductor sp. XY-223]|uniref:hypothetical protein n=1 Tax=Hyphomicrobiales TaxID=356 RepID=UPI0010AA7019|nr:hypothetical protein [Nitratireductor sp. XY-223]
MDQIDLSIFHPDTLEPVYQGYQPITEISDLDGLKLDFVDAATTSGFSFGPKDYWKALKAEMALLICGGDKKTNTRHLRKTISKQGSKSQTAVVSVHRF